MDMRFSEFQTKKPAVPKTPAQQRIHVLRSQIEQKRCALAAERERQRRAREQKRAQHAAQALQQ